MQRGLGGEPDSYRHWIVFDVVWPFFNQMPHLLTEAPLVHETKFSD